MGANLWIGALINEFLKCGADGMPTPLFLITKMGVNALLTRDDIDFIKQSRKET